MWTTEESIATSKKCATLFEFRHRDLIIRGTYFVAVLCYVFDPNMVGSLLSEWLSDNVGILTQTVWKHLILSISVTLVFAAAMIRTWATAYLSYDVMRNPNIHTDRLICDGPFGYLRNPLYLGNLFMVAGVSLMLSRTGTLVLVNGSLFFILRLVAWEEMELDRTHGKSFQRYRSSVPRWMSLFRRLATAAVCVPSFKNGVMGELLAWIVTVALAAYAATFDLKLSGTIFVCAFIPGSIRRVKRMRQRRDAWVKHPNSFPAD